MIRGKRPSPFCSSANISSVLARYYVMNKMWCVCVVCENSPGGVQGRGVGIGLP